MLEAALTPLGFAVHRWVMGEPPDGPTENMVAIRGDGSPHFGFAGHLDVVPPGEGWSGDPFAAEDRRRAAGRPRRQRHEERDRRLCRGAFTARATASGTLSLLITGDEEGYATYGTPRIIDWLNERQIRPT